MRSLEEQRLEDLRQIKDRIKTGIISYDFEEYAAFYNFSNEHINKKYSQIDFTNYHTALTVLSSGDHAFNAIYQGIDNVDTFDVNRLTEYYALGFKKRAIECLTFEQFCTLYSKRDRMDLEDEVIKNMDDEYKKFWEAYKYELKCLGEEIPTVLYWTKAIMYPHGHDYNAYLNDEQTYKHLQKRLEVAKISFAQANITELPSKFGTYDFIELSNILTYQHKIFSHNVKKNTTKLVTDIYDHNLNGFGTMLYQTGGTIVGDNPLALYVPRRLKRAKKIFDKNNSEDWIYGLQKGGRK
ncbi:MAG: DUF3419 family protein [Bacilli bacterium]|nr:DUF3419 family protein [Bacilli bacterium]